MFLKIVCLCAEVLTNRRIPPEIYPNELVLFDVDRRSIEFVLSERPTAIPAPSRAAEDAYVRLLGYAHRPHAVAS